MSSSEEKHARGKIVPLLETTFSETDLPLLEFTKHLFPNINLKNICVICAQHIVGTTRSLFDHLFSIGLRPSDLSVIGKCYSTNPSVFSQLKDEGVDVCPSSLAFSPHKSYDQEYRKNLRNFLDNRLEKLKNFDQIVVIDDGGELLATIHESSISKANILGIEQTSAGYHRLKKMSLQIPVINVARSFAKLMYETPFIADQLIDITFKKIKALSLSPKKVLILGNGAIGRALYDRLAKKYKLVIYDTLLSRSDIGRHELQNLLPSIDLIFGCTGQTSLPHQLHQFLKKDVVLASASSSDREFDSVYIREHQEDFANCHADVNINGVHLLNCGFPVNFSIDFDAIDIPNFQLTRSLLLAGVLQLLSSPLNNGLNEIDNEIQELLIRSYIDMYPELTFYAGKIKNIKP